MATVLQDVEFLSARVEAEKKAQHASGGGDTMSHPATRVNQNMLDARFRALKPQPEPAFEDQISPATQLYVDRINYLAQNDPDLLVAHAYVRYMGDLNGGQVLSRSIARTYNLDTEDGIHFYKFDGNAKLDKN